MKIINKKNAVAILTLAILTGVSTPALAAPSQKTITYKGIGLTPAIAQEAIDQSLPTISFKISVSNYLSQPVSLAASSLDFKSLNQSGGVAFISNNSGKYGLANWLKLPTEPITLKPHSSEEVTVTIENRADLNPGGHYAAVLFKSVDPAPGGGNKVDVNQVVSTLVFLKKSGGEVYELQVAKPNFGTTLVRLPTNVDLLIKNTGNTQTVPRGSIVITDPRGHEIRRAVINPDSGLILPDSTRLYSTTLFGVSHPWLPGRYSATISYRPDDLSQATTVSYSFFYLSPPTVIFFVIVVAAGVTLIRSNRSKK